MHTIETTVLLGICFLCLVILLQENIQLHERIREKAQAAYHEEVESHSLEKPKDYLLIRKKDESSQAEGKEDAKDADNNPEKTENQELP